MPILPGVTFTGSGLALAEAAGLALAAPLAAGLALAPVLAAGLALTGALAAGLAALAGAAPLAGALAGAALPPQAASSSTAGARNRRANDLISCMRAILLQSDVGRQSPAVDAGQ